MAEVKIISRPEADKEKPVVRIISRPQAREQPRQPGATFWQNYMRAIGEGEQGMREGAGRVVAPDASLWERAKGAGQAGLGALQYTASPVDAAARRIVGNPVEVVAGAMGASPETQVQAGDWASIASQVLGPGMLAKAPGAAVGAVRTMAREGADKFTDFVTGLQNRSGNALMQRRMAAPMTTQATRTRSEDLFNEARRIGVDVRPEAFGQFVDNVPNALRENRIISGTVPMSDRVYGNARELLDRLEDYRGHNLTLDNLHILQQESGDLVKRAIRDADNNNTAADARAAMIISRQIDDFVENLTPEQVVSGNPQDAVRLFNEAKDLWRRQSKMSRIENIVDLAERLNEPAIIQREFHKIATNPTLMRNYTESERAIIDQIARKGALDDIYEALPPISITRRGARQLSKLFNRADDTRLARRLINEISRGEEAQAAARPTGQPGGFRAAMERLMPGRTPGYLRDPNGPPP